MNCPICGRDLKGEKRAACQEHGDVGTILPWGEDADDQHKLFVSYGREDASKFVTRLVQDLRAQLPCEVRFDRRQILPGDLFEVVIENLIRGSTVVAAVMTDHALRAASVCRDEVVFALQNDKTILPLRPDPKVKPSLLLARRNWIDFSKGHYKEGLKALVDFLSGDPSGLREPPLPKVTGAVPLDFGVETARYSAGFMAREWLGKEIDRWLWEENSPVFVLVGEPGIGKSSVAAWLGRSRSDVAALYFCTPENPRTRDPYEFVASLVGQLHAQLDGFAEAVDAKRPELTRDAPSVAFRELIVEPLFSLGPREDRWLAIVDSLDEAEKREHDTLLDLLVEQAPSLPAWFRIVATTRKEGEIVGRLANMARCPLSERPENPGDLREFIDARLDREPLLKRVGNRRLAVADDVASLAAGNFLYARLTLDAIEHGQLCAKDVGKLEPGLAAWYRKAFGRQFPEDKAYRTRYQSLLEVLAVAQAPLSFEDLVRMRGRSRTLVHHRLIELGALVKVAGQGPAARYSLFHSSLQDWLTSDGRDGDGGAGKYWCDPAEGHRKLAESFADWARDDYALRHLPMHLARSGQRDRLAALLSDWRFLEAKVARASVFDLADDFAEAMEAGEAGPSTAPEHPRRRIVRLLAEALRRDIHFIQRHPETLFQCLWNSCWWYDSPQAADHYEPPPDGPARLPWDEDERLCQIMERWRDAKRESQGAFPWVRSLRPPAFHLGTAQESVMRGHERLVSAVAFCPPGPPDRQRIARQDREDLGRPQRERAAHHPGARQARRQPGMAPGRPADRHRVRG